MLVAVLKASGALQQHVNNTVLAMSAGLRASANSQHFLSRGTSKFNHLCVRHFELLLLPDTKQN